MKFRHFIYAAALVSGLALTSCDDFLDATPDERVELKTPEQIRLLLVDAYTKGNIASICEFSSDNVIDNNSPDENGMRYNLEWRDNQDPEAFAWDNIVSNLDQDSPSYVWEGCYHAIAVCNEALKAIEKFEAEGRGDEVSAHKGEALVSRAFHHFVLANVFALHYKGPELSKNIPGIAYMTEPEDKVLVNYERKNLAEVYDLIEKDLLEGLPLINDALYDVPKYHFNKKAANAFAARFYLYMRRYEEAEKYATEALGGASANPAGMTRSFWSKTFTSFDALVQAYISAQEQSNLLIIATNSDFFRRRGARFALNRDAKDATIYCDGPTWSGSITGYRLHPCYIGKIYLRASQEYGSFFPKAGEVFEYTDKVAGIGYVHVVRCEFTVEEALLTRAEARLWLSTKNPAKLQEAIADLAIWDRSRQNTPIQVNYPELTSQRIVSFYTSDPGAGIVKPLHIDEVCPSADYSMTAAIEPYLQCVLHFRRIETLDDGLRWFDIKRYGIEITHKIGATRVETLTPDDPRRALQIPVEVIAAGHKANERFPADGSNSAVSIPAKDLVVSK